MDFKNKDLAYFEQVLETLIELEKCDHLDRKCGTNYECLECIKPKIVIQDDDLVIKCNHGNISKKTGLCKKCYRKKYYMEVLKPKLN